jgi:glucose/arabinose dehydrogenase
MRNETRLGAIIFTFFIFTFPLKTFGQLKLTPHRVSLANGKSFNLSLPEGFEIAVAAQGLKRVRFMSKSPDNRIFVTDMYNLTDNKRGVVYILDDFDSTTKRFKKVSQFMSGLRNPNSVAFYTDKDGADWFYLALTDRVVRYRYEKGSTKPSGQPQVLATFPDYGLGYKYGGWHLTRTIAMGPNNKIYVSVGSSCNACEEKEEVRATVVEMDPDGKNQRYYARGLRNAVGLKFVNDHLFATNMGSDHLGFDKPADTLVEVREGSNYGWPYCYQFGKKVFADPKFNAGEKKLACDKVTPAIVPFDAHSSPLGLEYFDSSSDVPLRDSFLVALHGSTRASLGRGYRVSRVRVNASRAEDFITGFLDRRVIHGRPADVFEFGTNSFLVSDDRAGVIYFVYKR